MQTHLRESLYIVFLIENIFGSTKYIFYDMTRLAQWRFETFTLLVKQNIAIYITYIRGAGPDIKIVIYLQFEWLYRDQEERCTLLFWSSRLRFCALGRNPFTLALSRSFLGPNFRASTLALSHS